MSESNRFNTSYFKTIRDGDNQCDIEHLFLSVSSGLQNGPGIQRDGVTLPRMRDPHSVQFVCNAFNVTCEAQLDATKLAYPQRAGTWTIYHHLKRFDEAMGMEWQISGAQSCGDLTMNPWHIAYLGQNHHIEALRGQLCGLFTAGEACFTEPYESRIYRFLVKWTDQVASVLHRSYSWLDLKLDRAPGGHMMTIVRDRERVTTRDRERITTEETVEGVLSSLPTYNTTTRDIAPFVDFALSGKHIVERGEELPLAVAVNKFQDVRHIFNIPTVAATGAHNAQAVTEINLGEYDLYKYLNQRRAALSSAVIIDLKVENNVGVAWLELNRVLQEKHFKHVSSSPTRRGEYRKFIDDVAKEKVEIFFPHNVYPFGVLGEHTGGNVGLDSGGQSGKIGNTLEGITRIMYDSFGCEEAMVLDEGLDTCQVINPLESEGTDYRYTNQELLHRVLNFTKQRLDEDSKDSLRKSVGYFYGADMTAWPLNQDLFDEINTAWQNLPPNASAAEYSDVVAVAPRRSQIRSMIIFARRRVDP